MAFIAVALIVALAGCAGDPRDKERSRVVARVGDVEVRETRVLAALAQRGTARVTDPIGRASVARVVVNDLVEEQLLIQAAQQSAVVVADDEVDRELRTRSEDYPPGTFSRLLVAEQLTLADLREKVRRRLTEDAFLRARLATLPPIEEADVVARYEATVAKVQIPEQVRARQILVRTSEEASHILEQVRGRKISFEAAALKHSSAPDAEQGGDLGWFSAGEMPDVFDICFNLEVGTISDVVVSSFGFHIFQILERRAPSVESLDSARERIEEELVRERQSEAVKVLLDELRRTIPVKVYDDAIDRVVQLLPPPPETPNLTPPEDGVARALDSHGSGVDPIPALPKP